MYTFMVLAKKKNVYFYGLSLQLIWGNWKQAKKLTAKNEREATEADLKAAKMQVEAADLKAAKMQVEAADAAEENKKRLDKSM